MRTFRLLPLALASAILAPVLRRRLHPVRLHPTAETTPPIEAEDIRIGMRRLVLSDLHYANAKQVLRQELGLAHNDPHLRFGVHYGSDGIFLVHGNQFDGIDLSMTRYNGTWS